MSKVSVIVPVYRVEKYIHRCIDSILAQTFTDFELILVDDGSPDNCPAICDEYAEKDSRVRVIHKENGGVSVARNAALDIARGEFVAFCDSDDFWEPNLLERAIDAIKQANADCALFGYTAFSDGGILRYRSYDPGCYAFNSEQDMLDYLVQIQLSGTHGWELWSHIFSREVVEKYNVRCCVNCNNFAEDLGFVCRYMIHSKKLVSISDCLYNYYYRQDSMMRTNGIQVRLNDLNEVSYSIGEDFYCTIQSPFARKQFPIIHFMIGYNQIRKMYLNAEYDRIPFEISKLQKRKWWKKNIGKVLFCYNGLMRHFGAHLAIRSIMFASYLWHGNWRLYGLETGLYYKWYNRK